MEDSDDRNSGPDDAVANKEELLGTFFKSSDVLFI
jgi:hypothetical protein